jgi:hypothetical protein
VAGNVCRALRLAGPNLTLSAGPGAGLLGLPPALALLRAGQAGALLCGAVDELTERILRDRFAAGLLPPAHAPPPGEGAAVLLLETATHALGRGARPLAEVRALAGGTEIKQAVDADDDLGALEAVVSAALAQAGLVAEQVGALCADMPAPRLESLAARMCPAWLNRRVSVAPWTGWLEAAQILFDLDAVWQAPASLAGEVLAVVSSPHGVNCAAVLKRVETVVPGC